MFPDFSKIGFKPTLRQQLRLWVWDLAATLLALLGRKRGGTR